MGKKKETNLIAVDFFCGGGGMTYGLSKAGIKVIAGLDFDEKCRATYEFNNPESEFICRDITQMHVEELTNYVEIEKKCDNLIFIGCSPCQFWSIIKTNKSKSEVSKNLLSDFKRFIDYYTPGYILVENVPGLFKRQKESQLIEFLEFLGKKNYSYDHNVINMNDYGVPQHRIRYSLIATRLGIKIKLPNPDNTKPLKVNDVIGLNNGFKKIPAGYKDKTDYCHSTAGLSETNLVRIRSISKNGGTRKDYLNNNNLNIKAHENKSQYFSDVYSRMSWNKPAPTITTKFISFSNGRFGHPEEDRALSIREGATLQTFPKDYVFKGTSISHAAKIIGNAVPPEYAKRIGTEIIIHYQEVSYE